MKIYIACGLTHVPRSIFPNYTKFIHNLAAALCGTNSSIRVKYALVNSDPQLATRPAEERARLCYLWDRDMVEESDLVIADASFPSTGMGIELQIAENKGIPIIICFGDYGMNRASAVTYENPNHELHNLQIGEGYVTLMALGLPTVFRVIRYTDSSDGIRQILGAVRIVNREMPQA